MTIIALKKYGMLYSSRAGDGGHGSEYLPAEVSTSVALARNYPATVTLGGRAFPTNTSFEPYRREAFRHRTIQPQRQSINFENVAGYGTLNTEGLWRRDQMDWSGGAGQRFLDRKADSNSSRFYKSYGVDVWTENELSMLPGVAQFDNNTTYKAISVAGTHALWQKGFLRNNSNPYAGMPTATATSSVLTVNFNASWPASPTVGASITISGLEAPYTNWNGTWVIASVSSSTITINGAWTATSTPQNANADWDVITFKETQYSAGTYVPAINYGKVNDVATDGTHVFLATNLGIWSIDATASSPTATAYVKKGTVTVNTITLQGDGKIGTNAITAAANSSFTNIAPGMVLSNATHITPGTTVLSVSDLQDSIIISNPIIGANMTAESLVFTLQTPTTIQNFKRVWVANDILLAAASESTNINDPARVLCAFVSLPDPTAAPQASDVLMVHPNSHFDWTCATAGQSQIYMGGHYGSYNPNSGAVYRSAWSGPTTSATSVSQPFALGYPISCLPLETGEYPTALYAYLNFIFLGTNLGIRMCQTLNQYDPAANGSGDLKAGPLAPNLLQPVLSPVVAIVGNNRFIYFNWASADGGGTIGRMDLSRSIANDALSIAYAIDRDYSGLVNWLDWSPGLDCPLASCNFNDNTTHLLFVDNTANDVGYGYIDLGYLTYGIADDKIPVKFDAAVKLPEATNYLNPVLSMTSKTGSSYDVDLGKFTGNEINTDCRNRSERIGLRITLHGQGVVLYRATLQSWPAVVTETNITPVLMFYRNNQSGMQTKYDDPYEAFMYIQNLISTQQIVTYTEGPISANVVVQGMDWLPHKENNTYEHGFVGDCVVTLKTVGGYSYTATPST